MPNPTVAEQLRCAIDDLNQAKLALTVALDNATAQNLHGTYTAAINRILSANQRTTIATTRLARTLEHQDDPHSP